MSKESAALIKVIDVLMNHIAWDETLGSQNQSPMLAKLSEAKEILNMPDIETSKDQP